MKAYTDLSQSKKLAEILPLESADMDYIPFANDPEDYECVINEWNNEHEEDWIPAWSLAALLDILDFPTLEKDNIGKDKTGWMVTHYNDGMRYDTTYYDNAVDACVAMIEKLHELKML